MGDRPFPIASRAVDGFETSDGALLRHGRATTRWICPRVPVIRARYETIEARTLMAVSHKTAISYSWDDEVHKTWVREFATRLRGDGVDVTLDQWHLGLGERLPEFMESLVRDSRFVLIIGTQGYKDR